MDNKSGQVIPGRKGLMKDLSLFSEEQDKPKVSPQLQLAILQYLATGKKKKKSKTLFFPVLKI